MTTGGLDAAVETARGVGLRYAQARCDGPLSTFENVARSAVAREAVWRFSHPINEARGIEEAMDACWRPLMRAFPNFQRRNDIFVAGAFAGRAWTAATGHFIGVFEQPWLNIPANNQVTFIRFGEILGFESDQITDVYMLFDIIGVARQAGINLTPPGLGAEILTPAPIDQDGVRRSPSASDETQQSINLVDAMIGGLMNYDQRSLDSMGQHEFWSDDMLWYGPSGIGAARGLAGFQTYHQRPFLDFVPDRKGGDHVARFADGPYIASGG
ncbi:MAG: hypothetical protein AAGJ87_15315, partial [Pseudomonadota bacterium]